MSWDKTYNDIKTADKLINTYQTYIQQIYNKIKALQKLGNGIMFDDDAGSDMDLTVRKLDDPSQELNRAAYLWSIQVIINLEDVMRQVIESYGDFMDDETAKQFTNEEGEFDLWLPRRLIIDDFYLKHLNNNFKVCNQILDKIYDTTASAMDGLGLS